MTKEEFTEIIDGIKTQLIQLRKALRDNENIVEHRSNIEFIVRLESMCNQINEMKDYILED